MEIVFERRLPGGGYVMVERLRQADPDSPHARLVVERRADPTRRIDHRPPVVAEASGAGSDRVLADLMAEAADNVMVARRLLNASGSGRARF